MHWLDITGLLFVAWLFGLMLGRKSALMRAERMEFYLAAVSLMLIALHKYLRHVQRHNTNHAQDLECFLKKDLGERYDAIHKTIEALLAVPIGRS